MENVEFKVMLGRSDSPDKRFRKVHLKAQAGHSFCSMIIGLSDGWIGDPDDIECIRCRDYFRDGVKPWPMMGVTKEEKLDERC